MGDIKRRILVILSALLILFGVFFGVQIARERAWQSANRRAETVLADSARELTGTFCSALDGRFQALRGLAAAISRIGPTDPGEIEAVLDVIFAQASLSISDIDWITPQGMTAAGEEDSGVDVSDREYFQRAMSGKPAMERITGRLSGRLCMALAVPCEVNGEIVGVLRGLLYEEDMRQLLDTRAYGGEGYSFLINASGEIIVNAETEAAYLSGGNLLLALEGATFHDGGSMEALLAALSASESVALHYDLNGGKRVAVLTPFEGASLPENDWFLYSVVYEDWLADEVRSSVGDSAQSMLAFAAFVALALGVFFLLEIDYSGRQRAEADLARQQAEQFRIVTEQSGKFVMRYDIPTKTAYRSDTPPDGFGGYLTCRNAADSIIARGCVDPSSIREFREFFQRVDAGESPVSADFLMLLPDGKRRWYKYVSTTIFDRGRKPTTAIVSYFDDTEQRERELAYAKWQQELKSLSYENAALYEWNLTKDVLDAQRGPLALSYSLPADTFDARTAEFARRHVAKEDRAAYVAMVNREHLIGMYFSQTYRCSMEYRFIEEDGTVRWRRVSLQLVPYPDNQDVKAYLTNRDIDEEKRAELALVARSQEDYLTGVLNRETLIERVSLLIERMPGVSHALLMLDIDGFKQVNDRLGHDAGDHALRDFAAHIRSVLRAGDLVGRIGGDEFIVFLPDMPHDDVVARKANQLCAAARQRCGDGVPISASVGVAIYPRDGAGFDELYLRADAALYHAKRNGKNTFAFYEVGMSEASALTAIDSSAQAAPKR